MCLNLYADVAVAVTVAFESRIYHPVKVCFPPANLLLSSILDFVVLSERLFSVFSRFSSLLGS